MIELPKGWVTSQIDSLCAKPEQLKPEASLKFNYIDISSVDRDKKLISEPAEILGCDAPSRARKIVNTGDVLVSMTRPNLNAVAKVPEKYDGQIASTGFDVLKPFLIEPDWLFSVVKSKPFIDSISGTTIGALYPACKASDIRGYEMPLPPLAEQKRIVEKLDEVLAQVDTIKARLDGIPDLLKRFRQSVLASAISGKLTEEWRSSTSSTEWQELTIGDISIVTTGKTPKRTNSEYWNSEDVPWLTSSATGDLYCYEAEQFVSHFGAEDCKLKRFPVGTLLLAMYGEGKTRGQVTELMFEATCNQACAAIVVDETKALKSYVKLRLLENYEETRKAAAGGNQPNLNLNKVREIGIQIPSIEEQKEIVHQVDQYFAFADTIETQVKKAQARVDNLTQSILAKAFRGELVAQDPSDEPADKLLERIAEARKEAEALAKSAKKAEAAKKRAAKIA